jgi:hypothetical protein
VSQVPGPAASRSGYQTQRRLSGSMGVPISVVNTNSVSTHLSPGSRSHPSPGVRPFALSARSGASSSGIAGPSRPPTNLAVPDRQADRKALE